MKLDDLKQDWKKEVILTEPSQNLATITYELKKETAKLDREIKFRDFLEISISLLLIPFWGYQLLDPASSLQAIGLWLAIAVGIFIPYNIIKSKQVSASKTNCIRSFLETEYLKAVQQKQLLESIAWWYISPITLCIVLITLGARVDESGMPKINNGLIIYYGCLSVFVFAIYFINQRVANKKFTPLLKKIKQRLAEIND